MTTRDLNITEQLRLMEAGKTGPYPRDETLRLALETIQRLHTALADVYELCSDCGAIQMDSRTMTAARDALTRPLDTYGQGIPERR